MRWTNLDPTPLKNIIRTNNYKKVTGVKSKSVICQIPPRSWVDSWWVALQDVFRSKHLEIVTKPHMIWKPKLLHLHFLHHSWGLRRSMMILIFNNPLLCECDTKWIQNRLRQVFVNLSLLSRLCSSAATSLQLGSGANLNHFVSSGFKLLWSQIIVTKQKQNIRLICYMVTHYWGLMCMWYKNKLFNIIWYQYPTHQSPISTIWQMPSHMAWQLAASLGSTSDICVVSCCFMMLDFVLYIFRKIHGEHLRLRITCVTLPSTLVFNDAAFPVEMQQRLVSSRHRQSLSNPTHSYLEHVLWVLLGSFQ